METSPGPINPTNPLHNPYAPPAAAMDGGRDESEVDLRRGLARYAFVFGYGGLSGLAALCAVYALVEGSVLAEGFGGLIELSAQALGLVWLGVTWARIPRRVRAVHGKGMGPAGIVLRHFIPIVGIAWIFMAQKELCDTLDKKLRESGKGPSAPTALRIAVCTATLVGVGAAFAPPPFPLVYQVATAALWCAYMVGVEQTFGRAFAPSGVTA
jgi:hypothetical protein